GWDSVITREPLRCQRLEPGSKGAGEALPARTVASVGEDLLPIEEIEQPFVERAGLCRRRRGHPLEVLRVADEDPTQARPRPQCHDFPKQALARLRDIDHNARAYRRKATDGFLPVGRI